MTSPSLAAAVALAFAAPLGAQLVAAPRAGAGPSPTPVMTGDTVRAWARTPRLRGSTRLVTAATPDSLSLSVSFRTTLLPSDSAAVVPWTALTRLEVQTGQRASIGAMVAGGVIGLLGGAFVGTLLGSIGACEGPCDREYEGMEQQFGGFVLGAAVGMVGGAALGSRARVRTWTPVRRAPRGATP